MGFLSKVNNTDGEFFSEINHTGDVGVLVRGNTIEEIVQNSIKALASMYFDLDELQPNARTTYSSSFKSQEDALVDLLNFVIMEIDSDSIIYYEASSLRVFAGNLETDLLGFKITDNMIPKRVLKAVTYHEIKVDLKGGFARILFDI